MPIEQKLIVQCKSQLEGDLATDRCSVACNACGRCAADAPEGLIAIRQGYAQIDYQLNYLASPYATRRCPTGAIVWLENAKQFQPVHENEFKTGHNLFDNNRYYQ
jgi:ferredoxin